MFKHCLLETNHREGGHSRCKLRLLVTGALTVSVLRHVSPLGHITSPGHKNGPYLPVFVSWVSRFAVCAVLLSYLPLFVF
jgi:hypothetical protein